MTTIGGALHAAAARAPDRIAISAAGEALRYREFAAIMAGATAAAAASGIGAGDRIALIAGNRSDYIPLVAGMAETGAAVATLNPDYTAPELAAVLADCAPRLVLAEGLSADRVAALDPSLPLVRLGERPGWPGAEGATRSGVAAVDAGSSFAIGYTSGTTGTPKGVLLSHRSRVMTAIAAAGTYGCFGPRHRFLAATPLYHGAGFANAVANLVYGGSVDLHRRFDADVVLAALRQEGITGIFVVPTMLARLLDRGGPVPPALATVICNAAPCPAALKARFAETWGAGLLHESYGSTEAGIVADIGPDDLLAFPNAVGRAFPLTEIELRDAEGNPVADGTVGAVWSRSPYLFNGYHGRPAETAEVMRDGWVGVGDLAVRDAAGNIAIVGRSKDMIITGGVNVYPSEVEIVLGGVAGVREVAVVGLPDPHWGEAVCAVVVGDAGEEALAAAAQRSLAAHKRPKSYRFVAELPRNASGKLLKKVLRDTLSDDARPLQPLAEG